MSTCVNSACEPVKFQHIFCITVAMQVTVQDVRVSQMTCIGLHGTHHRTLH